MLAKTVEAGVDWDVRLPYVLFAYRAAVQASTGESPFLLYGRDPRLPTELALSPPVERNPTQLDDYKSLLTQRMGKAWAQARNMIARAQKRQKTQHDKSNRNSLFSIGDRVFIYMPNLKSGPAHKLACTYKGPYRILALHPNGVEVVLVDKPQTRPIRVALNRVRRDPANNTNRMDPASVGYDQDHEPLDRTPKVLDGVQQNEVKSLKGSDSRADQLEATMEPSERSPDSAAGDNGLAGQHSVEGDDPMPGVWTRRLRPWKK